MYDQHGRKRKVKHLYKVKKRHLISSRRKKTFNKSDEETYASAPIGEYTVPEIIHIRKTSVSNTRYRLLTTRVHTK